MTSFYISISLSPLLLLPFVAATCYNPDGTVVNDPEFQPCVFTVGVVSMCCATNRRNTNADKRSAITEMEGSTGTGGRSNSTFAMSQCSTDGSWCCGRGLTSEACCAMNIKNRIILADTVGVSSSTTSKSLTASSAISAGLTFSSDSGPTSALSLMPTSTAPASHSDTGKKAGIGAGVGTGVGVLAVAAIVAFFLLRRRRLERGRLQSSDNVTELSEAGSNRFGNDTSHYGVLAAPGRQHQELDTHRMRSGVVKPELQEVDATNPHEMPATPM
ncbi:hypothetical protein MMC22_003205 [Lobaria immixta]|nr:hypothetical protein [Lobaria immixta]